MPGRPRRRARMSRRNPADLIPVHTLVVIQHTIDYAGTLTNGPCMALKVFSPSAEYAAYLDAAGDDGLYPYDFVEWLTKRGCIRPLPHAVIDTGVSATGSLDSFTQVKVVFER